MWRGPGRGVGRWVLVAGALVLAGGCGGPAHHQATGANPPLVAPSTTTPPTTTGAGGSQPVWLCRPGATPDPCTAGLAARVVTASGSEGVQTATPAVDSPFDCFYVYPTVSTEPGANADLAVQPAEIAAAEQQASRFSSVCRVWAPMYRQVTLAGLFTAGLPALNVAYDSLLADWTSYVQHDNDGRPIVFIGHSQGAAMLIRLLAQEVDPDPALRARTVVAILAGGNLQVPTGQDVGATFHHIPLCTSLSAPGCAIAYSTFGSAPPADALFGYPGTGVSLLSLQTATTGQQVACVDPAAVGGGTGNLSPYFRPGGAVPWVTYPGLYTATCRSAAGATWLQVDADTSPGDKRPVVKATLGPTWGYHVDDVNLTVGNLVQDVAALEAAYHH